MRKVGSKILSWFLTVVIVLGLMPMNTYAAETHPEHKVCVNAEACPHDETCTHEEITDWQPLPTGSSLPSGNYYVPAGYSNTSALGIKDDAEVVICLNGQSLKRNIYAETAKSLKICDCSTDSVGKITKAVYLGAAAKGTTYELYSGTLQSGMMNGATPDSSTVAENNMTLNVYGGAISGTNGIRYNASYSQYTINIYGGTITGTGGSGIAVNNSTGIINVYDGVIQGSNIGIKMEASCQLNVNGGNVKGPYAVFGSPTSNISISGNPVIETTAENSQSIITYSTIDIKGNPTIKGAVQPRFQNSNKETYPIFALTGALSNENPVQVEFVNSNDADYFPIIADAWRTNMPNSVDIEEIANYFVGKVGPTGYKFFCNESGQIEAKRIRDLSVVPKKVMKDNANAYIVTIDLGEGVPSSGTVYSDDTYAPEKELTDVFVKTSSGRTEIYLSTVHTSIPLPAGTYYVKVESDRYKTDYIVVQVMDPAGPGPNGSIAMVDTNLSFDDIAYGDSFEVQASVPGDLGEVEWTWTSSNSDYVKVTPNTDDSSKATVTVLDIGRDVTITAKYLSETYTGTAAKSIVANERELVITLDSSDYEVEFSNARVPYLGEYSASGLLPGHEIDGEYAELVLENGYESGEYLSAGQQYEIVDIEYLYIYDENGYDVTDNYVITVAEGAYVTVEPIGAPDASVLHVESTVEGELYMVSKVPGNEYLGIKLAKVVDGREIVVADWGFIGLSPGQREELFPLEGGTYKVYYCYREAMAWDSATGKYNVSAESVADKICEVAAPEFVADNDNNGTTYTLDYANCVDGADIYVSSSVDKLYEVMMKAEHETLDAEDMNALKPRFFTYDSGDTWYALPQDKEIVIINSNPAAVEPCCLDYWDLPVYNFEATLKNISISYAELGYGDAVLTIDGNVSIDSLVIDGNVTVKGKGTAEKDVYTVIASEVIEESYEDYAFRPYYGGEYIINGVDEVSLGGEYEETAVYAENKIDFSNIGELTVVAEEKALYTETGSIFVTDTGDVNMESDSTGFYADGGSITLSDCADVNVTCADAGVYADYNITISNIEDLTVKSGSDAIYAYEGSVVISNVDALTVEAGCCAVVSDEKSVTLTDVDVMDIKSDSSGISAAKNVEINGGNTISIEAGYGISASYDVKILNVNSISCVGGGAIASYYGNVQLENITSMNMVGTYEGIYAEDGNVIFKDVLGKITVDTSNPSNAYPAVCAYAIYVSHDDIEELAVMSGSNADTASRIVIGEKNAVDPYYVGLYFEIKEYVFSLEELVEYVEYVLEELYPVKNETTEDEIKAVVNSIVASTDEDVTVEFLGYSKTKASANGEGKIEVKIRFNYKDQSLVLDAEIMIPISEYVEDRLAELRDAVADIPGYETVNGNNEAAISSALAIAEELLSDKYEEYLSDSEWNEVYDIGRVLSEKLEMITVVKEMVAEFKADCAEIPAKENVTTDDYDAIIAALEYAEFLLVEVDTNLTEEQAAEVEALKAELEEKLALINKVISDLEELIVAEDELPELEDITKANKEDVVEVLDAIDAFESAYAENITDEQNAVVAELKASVEERLDKIHAEIADVIEKVVKDTLASITEVTNDSDVKAKVKAAVDVALAADPTLAGVTVTYDITKVNATTDAEGSIKGKVVITSGDATKEVAVSIVIEKLPVPVHQHDFIWVIVKDATDTEAGKMEGTCACGETQTKEIPATAGDDASGKVTVESDEDNDFKAQLTDDEDVKGKVELTQDEQDAIIAGEDLEIILKLEDTTVEVDTAEKEDIAEKLAEKEFEGKKLGTFLDINLIKKIGNTETKITNTTGMLKLTFEVPASLINKDAAINRTYTIVRNHEGKVEFLKAEFNKETNQLTFETDKFSTYAVIYEDTAVVPEAPKTGDATNFMPILALLFAGFGMVVVAKKKSVMI